MAKGHKKKGRRGVMSLGGLKGTLTSLAAMATGVGVGFGSFIDQATKKWATANYTASTTIDHKFFDAIASFIGHDSAVAISNAVGLPWNGAADFHLNPMGIFNKHTGGGILLLFVDGAMRVVSKRAGFSRAYSAPGKFVRASGAGEIFGGIVGGLGDDPQPAQQAAFNRYANPVGASIWSK